MAGVVGDYRRRTGAAVARGWSSGGVFAHHHVSLDLHGVARGRPVYPSSVRGRPGEGRGLAG